MIDGNATLRRALADPSREARKRDLVDRLFGGQVSQPAVDVLSSSSPSAGRPSAT